MTTLPEKIKRIKYSLMLVLAAAIWGLGTVVVKDTVQALPAAWFVGVRFFSAGVIFCVIFSPRLIMLAREGRLVDHLLPGFLLGVALGSAYLCNTGALAYTTASKSAFLTGTYCIMVPFLAWAVTHIRPTLFNVVAACMCVGGVALMALPTGGAADLSIGVGEIVTIISAVFLAIHIVITTKVAPGRDMSVLTAFQFLVGGALTLAVAIVSEPAPGVAAFLRTDILGNLIYLVIFATCMALFLQNLGIAHVNPSTGALLLSLESVFGVVFGVLLLGDVLTVSMITGFVLIFSAVCVSEWLPTILSSVYEKRDKCGLESRESVLEGSVIDSECKENRCVP